MYLEENNLYCFGTLNNKLKLIRLEKKDEESFESKIFQELPLEEDSKYIINIIEVSKNILISSDSNNIIIYKYENNQFIKQSIIKISYQSYLQKIKDDEFCALISDDSLRFYKMKENEFIEDKKIKEIKTDFTILKNLELNKEEKNDNSIEKINIKKIALVNNDYLCVCGDKNNIYLIDLKKHEIEKIIILNPKNIFVSIINWINDSILILDQSGVLFF